MPWWSMFAVAAWKISLLASTTAARTSSSDRRRRLEPALQQLHGQGAGDLARLVPAHPVGDDEDRRSTRTLSSFCWRIRPGSVTTPHRSSAVIAFPGHAGLRPAGSRCRPRSRRSRIADAGASSLASVTRSPCSLRLQHRVADLDAVAGVEQPGAVQPVAVVERAVRRAEVLDHRLTVDDVDAGVALRDERVALDHQRAARIAPDRDLAGGTVQGERRAALGLRLEDDESPDPAAPALGRLAAPWAPARPGLASAR